MDRVHSAVNGSIPSGDAGKGAGHAWTVGLEGENACMIYQGRAAVAQVFGVPMHTALDWSGLTDPKWAEGLRVARLIAAAPDLLDHARADIDELEYWINNPSAWDQFDDGVSEKLRKVVSRARAVIALATGEQR